MDPCMQLSSNSNLRRDLISLTWFLHKLSAVDRKSWIWIALALTAVAAKQIYYLREMLAALILFSVLFAGFYIVALLTLLLVRASKPFLAWAERNVSRLAHACAGALKDAVESSVWARLVPSRARSAEFFARARKPVLAWAAPGAANAGRLMHLGVGAFKDAVATPVRLRAALYHSRRQQFQRNVLTTIARLRSAARKPARVYLAQFNVIGLRAGVVVVMIGSSLRRTVTTRLVPWLREPMTFRPLASPQRPRRLFLRFGRIASHRSHVFSRRPRTRR
jgi:hypothetical protein